MGANVICVFLTLMPMHNASQYISICAAPVIDSPRVKSNVFPLLRLGRGMCVSCVGVSGLTPSCYLLMPGQADKTLMPAYPYGSEFFYDT